MPLLLCVLALACGDSEAPDAVSDAGADAGLGEDAARPRDAAMDGGRMDASPTDAGREPDPMAVDSGADASPDAMATDTGPPPPPMSELCGDAIRDPVLEECDDGDGELDDLCTADCRVRDNGALPADATLFADAGIGGGPLRRLGGSAHPLAAGDDGIALAYLYEDGPVEVWVQLFDAVGNRQGDALPVGDGSLPITASDPAVAALPSGRFAVTWAERTGGSPDVALKVVGPGAPNRALRYANQNRAGTQQDADLVWTGSELVVVWTDGMSVKMRRFDASASALHDERALSSGSALASSPVLTVFDDAFAAAWRSRDQGVERIEVRAGAQAWSTASHEPGPSGDRPALLALDNEHLLLAYTVGSPAGGGESRVHVALLSHVAPGTVASMALTPLTEPYASDSALSQRRPSLARVGDLVFLAFQTEGPLGDALQSEVLVQQLSWSADDPDELSIVAERPAGRTAPREGDQVRPALAASPLFPEGALITAWEDRSELLPNRPAVDVLLSLQPTPFVELEAEMVLP